jgi:glycosyltransferase involved in cell wall biosynthesis
MGCPDVSGMERKMDVKKQKNKILFISNTSFALFNFKYGLIKTLKDSGYKVFVAAPFDNYSDRLGSEFDFIPLRRLSRHGINPLNDFMLFAELMNVYKREKPDLVLSTTIKPNIYSSLACRTLKIPAISTVTGLGYIFMNKNLLTAVVEKLYKIAFKKNYAVFFQNKHDSNLFIKKGIVEKDKIVIVGGSGVNADYFSYDYCKNIEKDKNKIVFLLIARMLWDKGIGEFIEAARILQKKYRDVEFWLLGGTDNDNHSNNVKLEEIKQWEKEGAVKYLGATDDVRPYICKSDCVVLPSYREGTPRSLLEAMAMEKPIITTDEPGCKDTVDDGINGFLCKIKNSADLADKMAKMINLSENSRREMGGRGRRKVLKEFDERVVISKYLEVIEKVGIC